MKNRSGVTAVVSFLTLLLAATTYPQNLFTEDFTYPVRDSLEGVGGWFRSGVNSSHNIRIISPGLTFSGYLGSGIGNAVALSNEPSGDIVLKDFPAQSSGSLYLSALISVDSLTAAATSGYVLGFDEAGGSTNLNTRLCIQRLGETHYEFGIAKLDSPVFSSKSHLVAATHLVVLKYTFAPGGSTNDTAKLFLFHDSPPPSEPEPDAVCTASFDIANLGQVFLSNAYAQTGLQGSPVRIDGIRVGTSWSGAVLSSVGEAAGSLPGAYVLEQNYPNPFNPMTGIRYTVGASGGQGSGANAVRLAVYDLLGREVGVLVNEKKDPGTYQVTFNALGLASGLYVYRLSASWGTGEAFVSTKCMMLLK